MLHVKNQKRTPSFATSGLTLLIFASVAAYMIIGLKAEPHIAMLVGTLIVGIVGMFHGIGWKEIENGMVEGMTQALSACIILLLIGVLIGIWISGGVVPAMIYYGLRILSPKTFLVGSMILCSLISMAIGSWGAAGTVGIALISVAHILGIPPMIAAGSIVSGCYIGDRISPLSDMSNMVSAVTEVDIFSNVKSAIPVNLIGFVLSCVIYGVLGIKYAGNATLGSQVSDLSMLIGEQFDIGFWCFVPLILLLGCIIIKIPATPSIVVGIISGAILAITVQGKGLGKIVESAFYGYTCTSGNQIIDALLSAGGIESLHYSLSLALTAMMFGGVMEKTGIMGAFMKPLVAKIHRKGELSLAVVVSTLVVNIILPDSYVAIALPGGMFRNVFRNKGISKKELSRSLGSGACSFSPLIPWNACGVFISTVLSVPVMDYMPYAFLNYLVPLTAVIVGFLGHDKGNRVQAVDDATTFQV